MRRSRSDQLQQLLGEQASAVVRAEDSPAQFQAAPPEVRRLVSTLAPNLVTFDAARDGETLAGQLDRAGQWLDNTREIAVIIGHASAAEAAAAALLANENVDAAFDEWMEDAAIVLDFVESRPHRTLLVNVRAACEAPAELASQFEMRFAHRLFRRTPVFNSRAEGTPDDDIAPVFVPAAKTFIEARPDVRERDIELLNVATLRERAFGADPTESIVRSMRALHRHFEHLQARVSDTRSSMERREAELASEIQLRDSELSAREAALNLKVSKVEAELKESRLRVRELEEQIFSLQEKILYNETVWRGEMDSAQRQIKRAKTQIADMEATRWWRLGAPFRGLYAALRNLLNSGGRIRRQINMVRADSLFDETWYKERYSDAMKGGGDAARHFVLSGWAEHKSPGPGFDIEAYLEDNPDVAGAGINPFIHYIMSGRDEGRRVRDVRERDDNMSGARDGA